jgi:hypothetical protein
MSVLGKLTGMSTPEKSSPSSFKLIEADLMAAGFTAFRDSTELMDELAALGPAGRSGIYVHFFAGDEEWFYLGLSVDVRKRYQQHIKNHTDIIKSAWLSAPEDQLVALELKFLSLMQSHRANLRNILKHRDDYLWDDIKDIFEGGHGERWLTDPLPDLTPYTKTDKELEANYAKRFAELRAHPDFSADVLELLNHYIRHFVLFPTKTDQMFWNLTCLTPGGYSKPYEKLTAFMRINIHMPEVFTAILNEHYEGSPRMSFNFHVAKDQFTKEDLARYREDWGLKAHPGNYTATGGRQIQFVVNNLEDAWTLLADPVFRRAAKVSNLRLMRQGLLARSLAQAHCLPLAKETLSQCMVWL